MVKVFFGSLLGVMVMAGVAAAGVDLSVNVGAPHPSPVVVEQRPVVVERERVVVKEKDHGKHKGWKKHHKGKKHRKHDHHD